MKRTLPEIHDFVAMLSPSGQVEEIRGPKDWLGLSKGDHFLRLVAPKDRPLYFELLKSLPEKSFLEALSLTLHIQGEMRPYQIYAKYQSKFIELVGLSEHSWHGSLVEEMIKINNQQVQEMRRLYEQKRDSDQRILQEMSALNNELINAKRLIQKQSAELDRYQALLLRKEPSEGEPRL